MNGDTLSYELLKSWDSYYTRQTHLWPNTRTVTAGKSPPWAQGLFGIPFLPSKSISIPENINISIYLKVFLHHSWKTELAVFCVLMKGVNTFFFQEWIFFPFFLFGVIFVNISVETKICFLQPSTLLNVLLLYNSISQHASCCFFSLL